MGNVNASKCDVLAQNWGAHRGGDNANLRSICVHTIAMPHVHVSLDVQPDQLTGGVLFATDEGFSSYEVGHFRFQRHCETNASLKGICLVAEIVA
jgi:hypothetical protein